MARVYRINKCRKEQKCSKCGKTIVVGSPYLKATPFHRPDIIRCTECGLRSWETSGSEFVQTCGRISDFWEDDYGTDYESLKSDLEDLRDTCQDSLDNMPEQLQYSPSGETLQERIDMLEDVISELDNIDEESLREEAEEEYRNENDIGDIDEYGDRTDELTQEQEEEVDNLRDDKIRDAIEEALSNLCY